MNRKLSNLKDKCKEFKPRFKLNGSSTRVPIYIYIYIYYYYYYYIYIYIYYYIPCVQFDYPLSQFAIQVLEKDISTTYDDVDHEDITDSISNEYENQLPNDSESKWIGNMNSNI